AMRFTPKAVAMMVTTVVVVTDVVVTGKAPLDCPPLTTVSVGTVTTAGLLLNSVTTAPSVTDPNFTVPVAGLPPGTMAGVNETEERTGNRGLGGGTPAFPPAIVGARSASACAPSTAQRGGDDR